MGDSKLKAYEVHDYEGHGCIVFATNSATARRKGANDLDIEWESVGRCRRAQWADQYAPGPMPPLAMIAQGWWFSCSHCEETVSNDSYSTNEDGDEVSHQPVAIGQRVFCCQEHASRFYAERRQRKAAEIALMELVTTKWPGVNVLRLYVYGLLLEPRNEDGDYRASACFTFPGGKHPVDFAFGDDTVMVYRDDVEAWSAFADGQKGGQQ